MCKAWEGQGQRSMCKSVKVPAVKQQTAHDRHFLYLSEPFGTPQGLYPN